MLSSLAGKIIRISAVDLKEILSFTSSFWKMPAGRKSGKSSGAQAKSSSKSTRKCSTGKTAPAATSTTVLLREEESCPQLLSASQQDIELEDMDVYDGKLSELSAEEPDSSESLEGSPEAASLGQEVGGVGGGASNTGRGRKRTANDTNAFGGEMEHLFASVGADITKSLDVKRKRLEGFTQTSVKTSNKKVDEVWKTQQSERQGLSSEYQKQSLAVMSQWEADIQRCKEAEDKLQDMFKQQQKIFQQQRVVQAQRLKTIKQLHEQYKKGMDDLEKCHRKQQVDMQSEIKKEMALLQKKMLMESQHQEISNVRRTLKNMLDHV